MRHGRVAELRGWSTYGPLELRFCRSVDAWELGEHTGVVQFTGGVTVGEFPRRRAGGTVSPVFVSLTDGVS